MPKYLVITDAPTKKEYEAGVASWGTPKRLIEMSFGVEGVKNGIVIINAIREPLIINEEIDETSYKPDYVQTKIKTTSTIKLREKYYKELMLDIARINPEKILILGGVALTTLLANRKGLPITKLSGKGFMFTNPAKPSQKIYCVSSYNPYHVLKDNNLFRELISSVNKLINYNSPISKPIFTQTICTDANHAIKEIKKLFFSDIKLFSCDLETTGFNPLSKTIESIGLGYKDKANNSHCILFTPNSFVSGLVKKELLAFFTDEENVFIFHNAKFDLKFLYVLLGYFECNFVDTMLMNYALDERGMSKHSVHSLKTLSRFYFDADDYHFNFNEFYAVPFENRDYKSLYDYQCLDLVYTLKLYNILKNKIVAEDKHSRNGETLAKLLDELLFPAVTVFAKAELRGVTVNVDYLHSMVLAYQEQRAVLIQQLSELVDVESFNPASPSEVSTKIFELYQVKTKPHGKHAGGFMGDSENAGSGKDVLQELQQSTNILELAKFIDIILQIRDIDKLVNTYFLGLIKSAEVDGSAHGEFNLHGTSTGRLSSTNPNLQNIPSRKGIAVKKAFIAPKDKAIVAADYSQLELRVGAWLTKDVNMIDAFKSGLDIHQYTASIIFNIEYDKVTKYQRFMAKTVNFGTFYGRGAKNLSEGAEMDEYVKQGGIRMSKQEAQDFINLFMSKYKQLKKWIDSQHILTVKQQYCSTFYGRKRRFPLILNDSYSISAVQRQGVNTPIQSIASDMCLEAVIKLDKLLPENCYFWFSIHDSIMVECPNDKIDEIVTLMKRVMIDECRINDGTVPIEIDIEVGTNWAEMTKYKK